tara:strand:+ start:33374 stop:34006 length:633 start_codon:yes stop_codon:yes gene_type:complete
VALVESTSLFKGIVFKRLSAVEADANRSNQHEFNGSKPLIGLFGEGPLKNVEAQFLLVPNSGEIVSAKSQITWYDARARHPTRTEFRLYYYDNAVTRLARPGDLVIIGRKWDDAFFVLITQGEGASAIYLSWLFGIEIEPGKAFVAIEHFDDTRFQAANKLSEFSEVGWQPEGIPGVSDKGIELSVLLELQRSLGLELNSETAASWIADM